MVRSGVGQEWAARADGVAARPWSVSSQPQSVDGVGGDRPAEQGLGPVRAHFWCAVPVRACRRQGSGAVHGLPGGTQRSRSRLFGMGQGAVRGRWRGYRQAPQRLRPPERTAARPVGDIEQALSAAVVEPSRCRPPAGPAGPRGGRGPGRPARGPAGPPGPTVAPGQRHGPGAG